MAKDLFTDNEVFLLKSLNKRVMNTLPNLLDLEDFIITGPAVAELAVSPNLSQKDKTFVIFAQDELTMQKFNEEMGIKYANHPMSFEHTMNEIRRTNHKNWFGRDIIDIMASDITMYKFSINVIVSVTNFEDWVNSFDPHPIYCLEGKAFVNRMRLTEARVYTNSPTKGPKIRV